MTPYVSATDQAPSTRIQIFLNLQLFLCGFVFRLHVYGEFHIRIRDFMNPHSWVEYFWYDENPDTYTWTVESDEVTKLIISVSVPNCDVFLKKILMKAKEAKGESTKQPTGMQLAFSAYELW